MSKTIHVLIADKHAGLREGIKRVVDEHQAMVIVGEATKFTQISDCHRQAQPDVLILSLNHIRKLKDFSVDISQIWVNYGQNELPYPPLITNQMTRSKYGNPSKDIRPRTNERQTG